MEFHQNRCANVRMFHSARMLILFCLWTGVSCNAAAQTASVPRAKTTATSISSSLNPSPFGQLFTFTASVSAHEGTPGGTVTFRDGANILGKGTLDSSGQTHLSIPWIPAGLHVVKAAYDGNLNFASSESSAVRQLIKPAPTYITVTSSGRTAARKEAVGFTATVSSPAATPTGSVTFKDGKRTLGVVPLNPFLQSTLSIPDLAPGLHNIVAVYSGDANFAVSRSKPLQQTVGR